MVKEVSEHSCGIISITSHIIICGHLISTNAIWIIMIITIAIFCTTTVMNMVITIAIIMVTVIIVLMMTKMDTMVAAT